MKETLKVEKFRDKKKDGGKVTVTDEREIRKNDDKKVYALDNHIFRSLANLIYFFEFINKHPDLIDKFSDDIEDFFGLKAHTDPKYPMFPRFIRAIIGEGHSSDYGNSRFSFRYKLLRIMQFQINQKAIQFYANPDNPEYQRDTRYKDMVWNNLAHTEMYMRLLDTFKVDERKKPSRVIDF